MLRFCGIQRFTVEKTQGTVDGNHRVIMGEVNVHRFLQWKCLGAAVQGVICLRIILHGFVGEPCQKFIDISNPLNASQVISLTIAGEKRQYKYRLNLN